MFVPGGMEGYFSELADALKASRGAPLDDSFHARMLGLYGMEIRRP